METAQSILNLSTIKCAQGRLDEAYAMLCDVKQMYEQHYGSESTQMAVVYNNLGVALSHMNDSEEADDMLSKACAIRVKEYGEDHFLTINSKSNLEYSRNKAASLNKRTRISDPTYPFTK